MNQQRTLIRPEILDDFFASARNAPQKGQAQFHTPLEFGRYLSAALPVRRPAIADLSCGNGSLLRAMKPEGPTSSEGRVTRVPATEPTILYGIDIDPCEASGVRKIDGDATLVAPLLAEVKWEAFLWALNPPWDIHWYRDRLTFLQRSPVLPVRAAFDQIDPRLGAECIDATIASLMIALDRMPYSGEGLLIGNNATLERLLFAEGAPYRTLVRHIWARLIFPGNPMTGRTDCNFESAFETGVLYFARSHNEGLEPGATQHIDDWQSAIPNQQSPPPPTAPGIPHGHPHPGMGRQDP